MSKFKKVIGLEIHSQIATKTKLFSRALNEKNENTSPNENVNWLDAGMPGSLPIANKEAIYMALTTSLALNMTINEESIFDRKHYFYQDSPLGYQITQFYKPIGEHGFLDFDFGKIRINRLHIEGDAGKSVYENGSTLIDLNRAGVGLMEIVTEPDFSCAEEVVTFLKELKAILLKIGTCECNMESGNFRVDVNISIHKENEPFGQRVEIKNLNSFKFIAKAIEYEANLQEETILKGEKVYQTTKLFDSKKNITISMRNKEDTLDYRYFPDPDLLPVQLSKEEIEEYKNNLPELPAQTRSRYAKMNIAKEQTYTLSEHPIRTEFFDNLLKELKGNFAQTASNWISSELIGKLTKLNITLEDFIQNNPNFSKEIAKIIILCEENKLSRLNAKDALDKLIENDCDIEKFIKDKGFLDQISNDKIISLIKETIVSNPNEVQKYKNGKTALIMFFVGCIMKATQGKCDPEIVKKLFIEELEK